MAQNYFFLDDVIKATTPPPPPCHHSSSLGRPPSPLRDDVIYGRLLTLLVTDNKLKCLSKFQQPFIGCLRKLIRPIIFVAEGQNKMMQI